MRLGILDSGHGFGTKALFALIRAVSRQPVLDVIKLVSTARTSTADPCSGSPTRRCAGPRRGRSATAS